MCFEPFELAIWIACIGIPVLFGAYCVGNVRGYREGMEKAHKLHQEVLRDWMRRNNLHKPD